MRQGWAAWPAQSSHLYVFCRVLCSELSSWIVIVRCSCIYPGNKVLNEIYLHLSDCVLTFVDQHLGKGVSSSFTIGYSIFSLSSIVRCGDWLGDSYSILGEVPKWLTYS